MQVGGVGVIEVKGDSQGYRLKTRPTQAVPGDK